MIVAIPGVKRRLVAGLSWRHEENRPKAGYIRQMARTEGGLVSIRAIANKRFQIGFAPAIPGLKRGRLFSLAAAVADTRNRADSWMGLYQISEGVYWYIAVRDGEIITDGDVVGALEDIEAIKTQHLDLGGWTGVDEGGIQAVTEIFRSVKKYAQIRDVLKPFNYKPYMLGALILAAGMTFAYFAHERIQDAKVAAARLALEAKRRLLEEQSRPKPVPKPWISHLSGPTLIDLCHSKWMVQPLYMKGWKLSRWTCGNPDGADVLVESEWVRDTGLASDAPGGLTVGSADVSSVSTAETFKERLGGSGDLLEQEAAYRELATFAQQVGAALTVGKSGETKPSQPALPGVGDSAPKAPGDATRQQSAWREFGFKWAASIPPFATGFQERFSAISVIRVSSLRWDLSKWTVEGVVYTK